MKKLSKDLKNILTGLAYQNASEFLSRREKIETLNNALDNRVTGSKPLSTVSKPTVSQQQI